MARLTVSLLGSLELKLDGQPVARLATGKARALLAYLAVEADRPHRRETLAGLLWPDWPERSARANLRKALSSLRTAIGDRGAAQDQRGVAPDRHEGQGHRDPFLLVTRETVQFNRVSDCWVDVTAFGEWVAAGAPAVQDLEEAIALYHGPFLEGFSRGDSPAFDDWTLGVRERLEHQFTAALQALAQHYERQGDLDRACDVTRQRVAHAPWQEQAHCDLMRLLALSGQRGAALAQYEACRRALRQTLDVEPGEETQRLYERIRSGDLARSYVDPRKVSENGTQPPTVGRLVIPTSPTKTPEQPQVAHNLPVQPTAFVGRETERLELERLLSDPAVRLVTILGAGGMGKTRLALQAAEAQLGRFADGVYFVPLAPLQSTEAIVPTIAEALAFSFYGAAGSGAVVTPRQQLLDYLRRKGVLLLLDNFEHLLDGVDLATDILKVAPDVKLLVTSRARLNVRAEHLFHLGGMDFPESMAETSTETPQDAVKYSAIKLFMQGVRRVRPDSELEADDLKDVAHICRLVQGMPLGILLAAAWVEMLTPKEIAAEIAHSLDFLATDLRDMPERQRSMRAIFGHSWNLLSESEQAVMQALSVFRGGFTREAAQQVSGASLRVLMALVNKSLLHRSPTGRYEIHELLRQFAAEKLTQSQDTCRAVLDKHCAYYATALQQWGEGLRGSQQQATLAAMDVEIENARSAWDWAVERGQAKWLDQAMEGLFYFYAERGRYQEGKAACQAAGEKLRAAASGDELVLRKAERLGVLVKVWTRQSFFESVSGHIELAYRLLQQCLALLDGPDLADQDTRSERAAVLLQMGHIAFHSDLEETEQLYEQSLTLYQTLGDRASTARALFSVARAARQLGAYGKARRLAEESLEIRQALGDQRSIADTLWLLGAIALSRGELEEAEHLMRESNALCREMGRQADIAMGLSDLGSVFLLRGKYTEAHSLLEKSVVIYDDLGHRTGVVEGSMARLGLVKMHLGQYEQTRIQGQIGLTRAQEHGRRRGIGRSRWLLGGVSLAEGAYAKAQGSLQESVAICREMGDQEALGQALALLGYAVDRLGRLSQAGQYLHEALQTAARIRAFGPLMYALPATALLLIDRGEVERAVELYALALRYPFVANSRWFEDVAGRHIAPVAATLPSDAVAAARERGRARDLWATAKELLAELEG